MKKGKKIGLALNKKVVSNFHQEKLRGGSSTDRGATGSVNCGGTGSPVPTTKSQCCYL
ncbi:MAG: hypothetical protein AAGL34_11875 [Bacteroidota bacterium]